jgi:hypothetical protein
LPEEHISRLIATNDSIMNVACQIYKTNNVIKEIIDSIIKDGCNPIVINELKKCLSKHNPNIMCNTFFQSEKAIVMNKIKKSNKNYLNLINKLKDDSNNYTKVDEWDEMFNTIHNNVYEKLSKEETMLSCEMLNHYVLHTRKFRIDRIADKFVSVVNHLQKKCEEYNMELKDMFESYPSLMNLVIGMKGFNYHI